MSNSFNDKINDYLEGKLNETDLAAFEEAMSADATLTKAVEVARLEKQSIELLIENDLRAKMKVWKSNKLAQNTANTEGGHLPTKKENTVKYLYLAVLVLAILGLILFLLNKNETKNLPKNIDLPLDTIIKKEENLAPPSPSTKPNIAIEQKEKTPKITKQNRPTEKENAYVALVNSMYDNPDFTNEVRDAHSNTNDTSLLKPILVAWENNDFQSVVSLSYSIGTESNIYLSSQEILGHAYFKLQKFAEAENTFANIAHLGRGQITESANWYRILCLIPLNKIDDVKTLLNAILLDKKHPRYSDAQKLLDKL